ncbi:MAG: DUF4394 domain-containing protein [Reyranellaceae bacterium]
MTILRKRAVAAALAVAASGALAAPATAASFVGLVGGNTLVMFDSESRKVMKTMSVTGVPSLLGIDVRPADGWLYGVAPDGTVVTIDTATGKATGKTKLKAMLAPGIKPTIDFNPAADRLRVMGSDGSNLRANVDDGAVVTDGALAFAEKDMHKGERSNIVAGAYTNSYKGTKATTLYDIDATIGGLIKQAPPNDGILNAVGKLGPSISGPVAFDIESDGKDGNVAWLVHGGTLHTVDLMTGKAMAIGAISGVNGAISDIAVLPAK